MIRHCPGSAKPSQGSGNLRKTRTLAGQAEGLTIGYGIPVYCHRLFFYPDPALLDRSLGALGKKMAAEMCDAGKPYPGRED